MLQEMGVRCWFPAPYPQGEADGSPLPPAERGVGAAEAAPRSGATAAAVGELGRVAELGWDALRDLR